MIRLRFRVVTFGKQAPKLDENDAEPEPSPANRGSNGYKD
jgi:hypothetical protein